MIREIVPAARARADPRQHRPVAVVHGAGLRRQRHRQRRRRRDPRRARSEEHAPTADYVAQLRDELPKTVPRLHVLLPAGRHHQPDPQLRPAGADRRPGRRRQPRREPARSPRSCAQRARQDPRHRRRPPPPDHRPARRCSVDVDRDHGVGARPDPAETSPAACWSRSARPARRRRTSGSTRRTGSTTCWPCRRRRDRIDSIDALMNTPILNGQAAPASSAARADGPTWHRRSS